MTNAYRQALKISRQAWAEYDRDCRSYQDGYMSDADFLASQQRYRESQKAFDAAWDAEQQRGA